MKVGSGGQSRGGWVAPSSTIGADAGAGGGGGGGGTLDHRSVRACEVIRGREAVRRSSVGSSQSSGGGDVIVSVGGTRVTDPDDVAAAIQDQRPGQQVDIEVSRGGSDETLSVTLDERPANATP